MAFLATMVFLTVWMALLSDHTAQWSATIWCGILMVASATAASDKDKEELIAPFFIVAGVVVVVSIAVLSKK